MPTSQAGEGHPRKGAGARAPEDRNHKGLDKDLAENSPAARSNSHADGNLARAVCRARCEQAAKVGASGKQHNPGQRHHPSQKTSCRPAYEVADQARTSQFQCQRLFILRILPSNAGGNRVQFSLHLGRGDPILDAHDRKEILIAPRLKPVESV